MFSISDIPVDIYLGMEGGEGIKAYSESEKTHRTIIRNAQDPEGLTFNWFNGKFYFTEANRIFSADENGTNVRAVFESKQCELTWSQWLPLDPFLSDFEFCACMNCRWNNPGAGC